MEFATLDRSQIVQNAHTTLYQLTETFRTLPLPSGETLPQPQELGRFLLKYPEYVEKGDKDVYHAAADALADSYDSTDGLPPEMQALAGSLIAITFSQEQLESRAGIN